MVAEPDDRRIVVPARLRPIAARTIPARRPVTETGAGGASRLAEPAGRAMARRAVRRLRGFGEFGRCWVWRSFLFLGEALFWRASSVVSARIGMVFGVSVGTLADFNRHRAFGSPMGAATAAGPLVTGRLTSSSGGNRAPSCQSILRAMSFSISATAF